MTEATPNRQQTRARLAQIEQETEDVPVSPRRFIPVQDYVRRVAALAIISVYGMVLGAALYIFYRQGRDCPVDGVCSWDRAASNSLELLKIGIMPIIALVIGFYFSRNSD